MSKTRIISILILFLFLPLISFAGTQEIKEHTVVKGDTLWGISQGELNDPFLWPDVWKANPSVANPDLIYPDQIIKVPMDLLQNRKCEEEVTMKPGAGAGIPRSIQEPSGKAPAAEQLYKGIKGIVLQDGSVIEGKIFFMNAEIVQILSPDGKISSYSFMQEVDSFIKEE